MGTNMSVSGGMEKITEGGVNWADGNKYFGEWRDDNFNGQGIYTWSNGDKYVGEWRDNLLHGHGTFLWPNGNQYEGEWRDDKPHGQGAFTFSDIGKVAEEIWDAGCLREFCVNSLLDNLEVN